MMQKLSIWLLLSAVIFIGYSDVHSLANPGPSDFGTRTVADVIKNAGLRAESRLSPFFGKAGVAYPPARITIICLKEEMELELWAESESGWVLIRKYDVYAASGEKGPKQRVGDRQVPEGIYRVTALNPNSRYHLSMKLDYPNSYDLQRAREDNRSRLGGDIYIHGKAKSCGCLAVGDKTIEELFILAAKVGIKNVRVIIAPTDLRAGNPDLKVSSGPAWLPELYKDLGQEMSKFRVREKI